MQGKLPLTPYGLFKDTRIADRQVRTHVLPALHLNIDI